MATNNEKPKTYKVKLNDNEMNRINMVEGDKGRIKLLSVYTYFVKHSLDGKVTKSVARFFKMYKRYHQDENKNPLTEAYFKKLVYKLIDMQLLIVEKSGKTNTYIIPFRVTKKVTKKVTIEKEPESVEIPSVEVNLENTQIQNLNRDTNTNTFNTTTATVAPVKLVNIAKKFMKEMKVKSKVVVDMVVNKLRSCDNVNEAGMLRYIEKVVLEKLDMYKQSRANINSAFAKKHYATTKQQAKTIQFTNYPQREYTEEFYKNLEKEALGLC